MWQPWLHLLLWKYSDCAKVPAYANIVKIILDPNKALGSSTPTWECWHLVWWPLESQCILVNEQQKLWSKQTHWNQISVLELTYQPNLALLNYFFHARFTMFWTAICAKNRMILLQSVRVFHHIWFSKLNLISPLTSGQHLRIPCNSFHNSHAQYLHFSMY